ncbi:hypothetical protein ACFL4A_04710 [bacterium]
MPTITSKVSMLRLVLISVGISAVIIQTVLIRELAIVFSGNELSISLIFASWLIWAGFGSYLAGKLKVRIKNFVRVFAFCQFAQAGFFLLSIVLVRMMPVIFQQLPGELMPIKYMLLVSMVISSLSAVIVGAQFVFGVRIYSDISGDVFDAPSAMYRYDSTGDMIGGMIFSFFLVHFFEGMYIAGFILVMNLMFINLLFHSTNKKNRIFQISNLLLIVFVISSFLFGHFKKLSSETIQATYKQYKVIDTGFSKYGNYIITKDEDIHSVYHNGMLHFSNPDLFASETSVHLAMNQVENPKDILIIGEAASGIISQVLKYEINRIDYIVLDKKYIEVAKTHINENDRKSLENTKVNIIYKDPRLWIKMNQDAQYDVALMNIGDPFTIDANRFYVREFFQEINNVLNEEGVFSFSISSNENYLAGALLQYNSLIYNTLKNVFRYIALFPGESIIFNASGNNTYLTNDPEIISKRIKFQNLDNTYMTEKQIPILFLKQRVEFVQNALAASTEESINRDFHPRGYYYALKFYSEHFGSLVSKIFNQIQKISFIYYFAFALFILLFSIKLPNKYFVPMLTINTGFICLCIELLVIYGFQMIYGNVYIFIGLIIAASMFGIVLGSKYIAKKTDTKSVMRYLRNVNLFLCASVLILLFAFIFSASTKNIFYHKFIAQIILPLIAVFGGLGVGLEFPLVNRYFKAVENTSKEGLLYACDLFGACLGALFIPIVLLPSIGMIGACMFLVLLCCVYIIRLIIN